MKNKQVNNISAPLLQPSCYCPKCGYCPHCGRGGPELPASPVYPNHPWPNYPQPYVGDIFPNPNIVTCNQQVTDASLARNTQCHS